MRCCYNDNPDIVNNNIDFKIGYHNEAIFV